MLITKIMNPLAFRAEFTITVNKVLADMQARAKLAFLAHPFIVEFADIWYRPICCSSLDFAFVYDYFQNFLQKGGTKKIKTEVPHHTDRVLVAIIVRSFTFITKFTAFFDKERA